MNQILDLLKNALTSLKLETLTYIEDGVFLVIIDNEQWFGRPLGTGELYKQLVESDFTADVLFSKDKITVQYELNKAEAFVFYLAIYQAGITDNQSTIFNQAILHTLKQSLLQYVEFSYERMAQEILLDFSNRLISSIEVDEVLLAVIHGVKGFFKGYECTIWLSHDYNHALPVKVLNFQDSDLNSNTRAFILGQTLSYDLKESKAISAPIRGKQGVYGVLQIVGTSPNSCCEKDIKNVTFLADTAGTALENANLYLQSQRLISQLQLINEASQQLSKTLNLESNIDFLVSKIHSIFKPEGIHFLAYRKPDNLYKMIGTTHAYLQDEEYPISPGTILHEVHQTKEPCITTNPREDMDGLIRVREHGIPYYSLMMVPMLYQQQVEGMFILTHSQPNQFSYDEYRLLQTLVHHASFAYINSSLHEQLNRLVITDNLTTLYTRKYLDNQIQDSQTKDLSGSLILIDIDNFKMINDTFGHQVGDKILIKVAEVMKSCIRDTDVASRWGGEELAIYLPNISIAKAVEIANRIRERVATESIPTVTISCGVSYWKQEDHEKSLETLFQKADESLYEAKGSGKNKVVLA